MSHRLLQKKENRRTEARVLYISKLGQLPIYDSISFMTNHIFDHSESNMIMNMMLSIITQLVL